MGWERKDIEEELSYSENYISQQLSRGGNKKMFNSIGGLLKRVSAGKYVEYDMAAGIKKIEAMNQVILTALAEILAKQNNSLASTVKGELENLVNKQLVVRE